MDKICEFLFINIFVFDVFESFYINKGFGRFVGFVKKLVGIKEKPEFEPYTGEEEKEEREEKKAEFEKFKPR